MDQAQKEYYSVEEVARIWGVNEYTVREWAKKGEVLAIKRGRMWFFPKESVFPKDQPEVICNVCGKPHTEFRDEISRKEARISGMCQDCQDKTFKTE